MYCRFLLFNEITGMVSFQLLTIKTELMSMLLLTSLTLDSRFYYFHMHDNYSSKEY